MLCQAGEACGGTELLSPGCQDLAVSKPSKALKITDRSLYHHFELHLFDISCTNDTSVHSLHIEFDLAQMFVQKRDGRHESVSFDKITARVTKLSYGLHPDFCDPVGLDCTRLLYRWHVKTGHCSRCILRRCLWLRRSPLESTKV